MWYKSVWTDFVRDAGRRGSSLLWHKQVFVAKQLADGNLLLVVGEQVDPKEAKLTFTLECWSLDRGQLWKVDTPSSFFRWDYLLETDRSDTFLLASTREVHVVECAAERPATSVLSLAYGWGTTCLAFVTERDARFLAVGWVHGAVVLYDMGDPNHLRSPIRTISGISGPNEPTNKGIWAIAQLPDENLLTCNGTSVIKIWNLQTGELVRAIQTPLVGYAGCRGLAVANGKVLLWGDSGAVALDPIELGNPPNTWNWLAKDSCRDVCAWRLGSVRTYLVVRGNLENGAVEAVDLRGRRLFCSSVPNVYLVGSTTSGPLLQTNEGMVLVCLAQDLQSICCRKLSTLPFRTKGLLHPDVSNF